MRTYDDLIRLARTCELQARGTINDETAAALRQMSDEYCREAATLKVESAERRPSKVA